MKAIRKSKENVKAHRLINAFLERCQAGGTWPTDLYEALGSDKDEGGNSTFTSLRDELTSETDGLCCYCMRKLTESNTTLEHVIPNKLKCEDEYNAYEGYYSPKEWEKLQFSKSFLSHPSWPQKSCPHTVAYENLVPSCNGKMADLRTPAEFAAHAKDKRESKCCNNKRGSAFVPPFVYDETMCREFEYNRNGVVVWNDESSEEAEKKRKVVNDILGLNCEELRTIRRLWFFLASNNYDCHLNQDEIEAILFLVATFANPVERDAIYKFQDPRYWALLEEYRYFNDENLCKR